MDDKIQKVEVDPTETERIEPEDDLEVGQWYWTERRSAHASGLPQVGAPTAGV